MESDATEGAVSRSLPAVQGVSPVYRLDNAYVKAIGYMSSIPAVADKGMPTLATLVAESCRAIADAHAQASAFKLDGYA